MTKARQDLHDQGRRLLAEHYPHLPVERLKIIQGDSGSRIWRATTQIGDVCLKRTNTPSAVLEFTTAAHEYIFRNDGRVPELLPTAQGARFAEDRQCGVVLSGWIQGSPLVMDDAHPHLHLAAETLARFHIASVGFEPPAGVVPTGTLGQLPKKMENGIAALRDWQVRIAPSGRVPAFQDTVEGMLGQAQAALGRLRASGYAEWVQEVSTGGGMLGHGRFRKGNALVVDDGACILDLEHLQYSLPNEDLRGVILGWMETQGHWNVEEFEAVLGVYSAQLPLSDGQRAAIHADLLFPHTYLNAARRSLYPEEDGLPPDLTAVAAWEEEKARLLLE